MLLHKPKKKFQQTKGNRLLITVNVLGSAGPIRFLVNETELVASVIDTALRSYAREGRLPVLGSDLNNFLLYCAHTGSDALNPWETIGSLGGRNFLLCKKQLQHSEMADGAVGATMIPHKGSGSLKAWFNKFLSFKISFH